MDVAGQVALRFTGGENGGGHVNLTAVRADGEHLWVAGDETATLDRLVLDSTTAPTRAGRQRSFRLADLVQLPGTPDGESDVQGIARAGGWLWAVGSHALVRRRPKPGHDEAKCVRRLAKLRRDPNRFVIARLAVQPGVDRHPEPVRVARDGRRSAVVGAPGAETLVDLLHADPHLAPFLAIPARDNGFDVQGIAAVDDRLFVGLRGPVLRGWAVVLEVRPVQDPTDPGRLALGIFPEGGRYRKHFLDLGGLGVRDLCPDGDDLLVLAGPTMTLAGAVRVHRWLGAGAAETDLVVHDTGLPVELAVPFGEGDDHPDGLTLLPPNPWDPGTQLLVVYDNPAPARRPWPDTVLADRIRFEPAPRTAAPGEGEEPRVEAADPGAPGETGTPDEGAAADAAAPEAPEPPRAPAAPDGEPAVPPPTAPEPAETADADPAPTPEVAAEHPAPDAPDRATAGPGAPTSDGGDGQDAVWYDHVTDVRVRRHLADTLLHTPTPPRDDPPR